jgi:hypothetical protein
MPNYILSRTSPPAHIYERKINLGYGVKVDVSDAPQPKGKNMTNVKQTIDVAQPANPAFADGTVFVQDEADYPNPDADLEAEEAEEAKG